MTGSALVIGAGPAGLMAAEVLAASGARVTVADAMPTPGRKLLMAGKSGLNLTKSEPPDRFLLAYGPAAASLAPMLSEFGQQTACSWAEGLGQPVFTGSSGRVFPVAMKASPLLRAWIARLDAAGVRFLRRWRWVGWSGEQCCFDTPEGRQSISAPVTVLALGGASWSRLGSDGAWSEALAAERVPLSPFLAANAGIQIHWSPAMTRHFGVPVKAVRLTAGRTSVRGEAVISERGLEGSGVYGISSAVRDGAGLTLDLLPDISLHSLTGRLSKPQGKMSLSNYLRKVVRLPPVKVALLREFARPMPSVPVGRATLMKALPVSHAGLRPLDEAISTAGGVSWSGVDSDLMLLARPGTYVAGEMLDWEAPTGGYLLTACLSTGYWAGRAAARRLA